MDRLRLVPPKKVSGPLLWGRKKKSRFEIWIFFRKMKIFQKNFGWESPPIISFFAHIHGSPNPFLSKIKPKTWFLPFSKQWKKWYLTPIFEFLKNGYYEFCSVSRFGLKQSIAIFCTTRNRFWTRFDWFRQDWKSCVFDENQCFFFIDFAFKIDIKNQKVVHV